MSTRQLANITQWQTMRSAGLVTADDVHLTTYSQNELTAAVRARMTPIHPATAIIMRGFGQGADAAIIVVTISGWMDGSKKSGFGPGHRLYSSQWLLSAKTIPVPPITDGHWPDGTYREVDTFGTPTIDQAGVVLPTAEGDKENCLILPTLGYTHLLVELDLDLVGPPAVTGFNILWRPIRAGEVHHTGMFK